MRQVALDVHLLFLALGRRGQGDDAKHARADALGDRLDRAALAGAVAAFEHDADLQPLVLHPPLELDQLDVQPLELPVVVLALSFVFGPASAGAAPRFFADFAMGPPPQLRSGYDIPAAGPGSSQIAARNAAPAQRSGCGPDRQYPSALRITSIGGACPVQRSNASAPWCSSMPRPSTRAQAAARARASTAVSSGL